MTANAAGRSATCTRSRPCSAASPRCQGFPTAGIIGGWRDATAVCRNQIAARSQLPDNTAEALLVLDYARQMLLELLDGLSGVSSTIEAQPLGGVDSCLSHSMMAARVHRALIPGGLFEASGNAAELLELAEAALDEIALGVEMLIERVLECP